MRKGREGGGKERMRKGREGGGMRRGREGGREGGKEREEKLVIMFIFLVDLRLECPKCRPK